MEIRQRWFNANPIGNDFSFEQKIQYGKGVERYCALAGALISMAQRVQGKKAREPIEDSLVRANEHAAIFLQSLPFLEQAAITSRYLQFAALAKQAIDGFSSGRAHLKGTYRLGKTPRATNAQSQNIGNFLRKLQPAAHLSNADIIEHFAYSTQKDARRFSWMPEFNADAFAESVSSLIYCSVIGFDFLDEVWWRTYGLAQNGQEVGELKRAVDFLQNIPGWGSSASR